MSLVSLTRLVPQNLFGFPGRFPSERASERSVGGDLSKVRSSVASNRVGNSPNKRSGISIMGHSNRGRVSYVSRNVKEINGK